MKTAEHLERHRYKCEFCNKSFLLSTRDIDHATKPGTKVVQYVPLPVKCHSYFCSNCAKQKKAAFLSRANQFLKKETWRFLTLTTNKGEFGTEEALAEIDKAWNRLRTVLARKYKGFMYIRFIEISKTDSVHLHILINKYIPQEMITMYWTRYYKSPITWINKVISHDGCLYYLTKYMSKAIGDDETNIYFFINDKRRFSFSRFKFESHKRPSGLSITDHQYIPFKQLIADLIFWFRHRGREEFYLDLSLLPPEAADKISALHEQWEAVSLEYEQNPFLQLAPEYPTEC